MLSPAEEDDLHGIERTIGKRLPRVILPDFDYTRRPTEKLEVPIHQRKICSPMREAGASNLRPVFAIGSPLIFRRPLNWRKALQER